MIRFHRLAEPVVREEGRSLLFELGDKPYGQLLGIAITIKLPKNLENLEELDRVQEIPLEELVQDTVPEPSLEPEDCIVADLLEELANGL